MCRSLRRVPAGWTWWGGALATRFWGTVRCVDCRAEFSPKTGLPDHRARFLTLIVRVVAMFLVAGGVGWTLVEVLIP